jgi:hypothetical protein
MTDITNNKQFDNNHNKVLFSTFHMTGGHSGMFKVLDVYVRLRQIAIRLIEQLLAIIWQQESDQSEPVARPYVHVQKVSASFN